MTTNDMVTLSAQAIDAVSIALKMREIVMAVSSAVLRDGVDFGIIPGTGKPGEEKKILMKPGAERLCSAFKLYPVFSVVSQVEDWEKGVFFYRYECALIHRETGECYGRGIGSCNSQENKYGWRWMSVPPSHLDKSTLMTRSGMVREPKFAIDKAETGGKYGKPAEYWQMFRDAIASGAARKVPDQKTKAGQPMEVWEVGGVEYRIPNPDIFDLVNTIDKMGQKRALIAATLIAVNASEFYTQDVEDFDPSLFGLKVPTITISDTPTLDATPLAPSTAHWSTDSAAMEKMYEWALKEHKATKNDVNALIAKTGKTILTLEKTAVMNAVKQWAIMQTVDALPVPDEYTMRMEGRTG